MLSIDKVLGSKAFSFSLVTSLLIATTAQAQVAAPKVDQKFSEKSIETYLTAMEKDPTVRDQTNLIGSAVDGLAGALDGMMSGMDSISDDATPGEVVRTMGRALTGSLNGMNDAMLASLRVSAADYHINRINTEMAQQILPRLRQEDQRCAEYIKKRGVTYIRVMRAIGVKDDCADQRDAAASYVVKRDSLKAFASEKAAATQESRRLVRAPF